MIGQKPDFNPQMILVPAPLKEIIGVGEGLIIVSHNLPTNSEQMACCWLKRGEILTKHALCFVEEEDAYEPLDWVEDSASEMSVVIPDGLRCAKKIAENISGLLKDPMKQSNVLDLIYSAMKQASFNQ